MIEVPVELGARRYDIHIGEGLAAQIHRFVAPFAPSRVAVVTNPQILALHGKVLHRGLRGLGSIVDVTIPAGERHKSQATLTRIHDVFAKARLGRDALVIAFGGGVVGDIAGFAAATYMRGIPWVQVPTTLLAMVDSSVGGKVGINHPSAKNLIGAFHQPRAVITDPTLLRTLPPRELRSGAYEIIKCGILSEPALFESLKAAPKGLKGWDASSQAQAIAGACRIKAQIVSEDEREGGLRRVLNLGHTLGHAFEAVTHYRRFTHGEAVGWGLIGAAWLAQARGMIASGVFDAIAQGVDHLGPRPSVKGLPSSAILAAVAHDKKAQRGRVPFILPTAIGRVKIENDIQPTEIRAALKHLAARRSS